MKPKWVVTVVYEDGNVTARVASSKELIYEFLAGLLNAWRDDTQPKIDPADIGAIEDDFSRQSDVEYTILPLESLG